MIKFFVLFFSFLLSLFAVSPEEIGHEEKVTNITYKDGVNTYTFSSLEEAQAEIEVKKLPNPGLIAKCNRLMYASDINEFYEMINDYRVENNITEVELDDTITLAACERAVESAYANWNMTGYIDDKKHHIRPNYLLASSIFLKYGINGNFGENYVRFYTTKEEAMNAWKASSSHNALLLSEKYTKCGIGVAADSDGYYYCVVLFN